jgi:transcriptional regulator with XRE-family HTH domain
MQILHICMRKLHKFEKIYDMSFGDKLKKIRKENNLSQLQMGEKLSMEQSTYSRYETNESKPTLELINRVVNEFHVSMDSLFESDTKTVIFEGGSTNTIGVVQAEHYYAASKDVIDILQKTLDTLADLVKQIRIDKEK